MKIFSHHLEIDRWGFPSFETFKIFKYICYIPLNIDKNRVLLPQDYCNCTYLCVFCCISKKSSYTYQCPIEVGNISFRWRVVGIIQVVMESFLALPDFSDCFFEYRHDITEIHWRMVWSTGRGMIWGSLGPSRRPICRGLMGIFIRIDSNGRRSIKNIESQTIETSRILL